VHIRLQVLRRANRPSWGSHECVKAAVFKLPSTEHRDSVGDFVVPQGYLLCNEIGKYTFDNISYRSPDLFYLLTVGRRGCLVSFDHTQTHTTVCRTPLDEGSARRRDLYLTTQTLTRDKHPCPCENRTHDPSKRSAADLLLRPRGHWDRLDNI
jgi:hypothetical protein